VVTYACLVLLVAAFFLGFYNRFAGLRSGAGEYTAGVAFLSGHMPYRDYFTTAPPLNLLKSALLLKVFGTALIVSRSAGVLERMLLAAVLFRWLRQIFAPAPALVASVVAMVVSAGDRTDPIASYNHDAILFAMLSGLAASFFLERGRGMTGRHALGILSGVFAGLSVLTKQTVGLGAACTVFGVVALLLFRIEGLGRGGKWMAAFAGGCLVPIAAAALLLARFHLLRACLTMLFVTGPAAKAAHASDFLLRDVRVGWDNFGWLTLGMATLLVSWRAIKRFFGRGPTQSQGAPTPDLRDQLRPAGYVFAAGMGVLGLAHLLRDLPALHDLSKAWVYFTAIALTMLLGKCISAMRAEQVTPRRAQLLLFCAVSWSVAFTLSLSWPAFEAMTLPGLGLLVAAVLSGAEWRSLPLIYAALVMAVLMQAREKLDLPFGFDYQDEGSVRGAYTTSTQPQMRGMLLPRETVRFLDETVATVRASTRPDDRIFTYPEMGLIYALSGRTFPTLSGSHNIDVVPDSFAAAEADRLLQRPPAVIVFYRETGQQKSDAERLWRDGRPSGQRLLADAIEEIVRGYRMSGSYCLGPGDPEIQVYVRP